MEADGLLGQRGLLGVLVSVATSIVLVVVAVVVPLRFGSSSWGTTNLGDGTRVTLRSSAGALQQRHGVPLVKLNDGPLCQI
jgi:hypothetical protein